MPKQSEQTLALAGAKYAGASHKAANLTCSAFIRPRVHFTKNIETNYDIP